MNHITSRMELYELHVLQRYAGPRGHGAAVAGAGVGCRAGVPHARVPACSDHCVLCLEPGETCFEVL